MSDVKPVAWMPDAVFEDLVLKALVNACVSVVKLIPEDVPLYNKAAVDALQAEIEALRQKVGTGRAVIVDLLDQVDSLQSYELTRDLEGYKAQAIWDSAIENAKRYAAIAKEK